MRPLMLSLILILHGSCGGVIGNIQKYPLDGVTYNEVTDALKRVYLKYPELRKSDTTRYGMNRDNEFYFVLDDDGKKYVFKCHVINYSGGNYGPIDLSLTTATEWGKQMDLATKIGFFEKREYKNLFEQNILTRIKEELTQAQAV